MKYVLFVLSAVFALIGMAGCAAAKSSVHDATAGVYMVVAAVFFGAAGVVDAIEAAVKSIKRSIEDPGRK